VALAATGERDLSTDFDPGLEKETLETPFSAVPAADDPRRGKEVWAPVDGPFEVPVKEIVPGPLYVGAEERLPELEEAKETGDKKNGGKFPVDRRDFMKLFSASSIAATAACVQRPVEMVIPYVQQPVDSFPGEAVHYATTCGECAGGCGVMVRTREGRPTKVEGLPDHPINNGRLCATGQSAIQGLFHPERMAAPKIRFANTKEAVSWEDVYKRLSATLNNTQKIGIFTPGSTGHRNEFLQQFLERFGSTKERLYTHESNTLSEAIVAAHQIAYGVEAMPRPDLHSAKMIVGVGADFLDLGTSLVFTTMEYAESHKFKNGEKSRHVQFEATMTLTGSKADERLVIPPGSETVATLLLVRALLENAASKSSAAARAAIKQVLDQKSDIINGGYDRLGMTRESFDKLAGEMLATDSVVMAGGSHTFDENATNLQLAAIMANELLGAYDKILHFQQGWMLSSGKPGGLTRFLAEAGDLDVLFIINANPVFTLPASFGVAEILKKIPNVISMQDAPCETDEFASYVLPVNHYLESWGDEQPVAGLWSIRQPAVRTTTDSRQAEDALMWLAATANKPMGHASYREYLKARWSSLSEANSDPKFFEASLRKGYVRTVANQAVTGMTGDIVSAFRYVDTGRGGLRLIAHMDYRLRDGRHAHKPVLQETADTLTTITWDTWIGLNPTTMAKLNFKKYDVVKVEGAAGSFESSVYPLPGLHPDAVVVPRGNGHTAAAGQIAGGNGVDPLIAIAKAVDAATGAPVTTGQTVTLTGVGRKNPLAQLQKANELGNRTDIVKKVSLASATANMHKNVDLETVPDLYPKLPKMDYKWGMSIDLSSCTGCGACVVACFTENNVPQVGREQVLLGREMHWMKIDRYFAGPTDNPEVSMQPMLCQHCEHAPCEAVCPVYATTHDPEGINAMTYNRCIGTRYCANACPYKIRRFNWWTHKWNVVGERMQDRSLRALNPDVTVRTRGVMEKCTFCYQRVRDAKHSAKLRGTMVKDGDVKTACQQTCPADAIAFGNLNDPESAVTGLRKDYRSYLALNGDPEHKHYGLKTLPGVNYLAEVKFHEPVKSDDHHG
jgi:Fe-S-cluster-containing dehydrogenase component/anaerobic selenocysteine-containing dehydrogenase